jgi:hypothetical protein
MAPTKSRVETRLSASRRISANGTAFLAAATSWTLTSQIFFRMSDMVFLVGGGICRDAQYLHDDAVHAYARHDEQQETRHDPGAGIAPDGRIQQAHAAAWPSFCE